jgi:hypothetical protein
VDLKVGDYFVLLSVASMQLMLQRFSLTAVLIFTGLSYVCSTAVAQEAPRPFHEIAKPKSAAIDTDGKARALVAEVLKQYGLKMDDAEWEIWITQDDNDTPNAASNFVGKRQIFFNGAFMAKINKFSKQQDWTLYAIAAHEIGHHLGNHVLRQRLRRQLAEREADYHAGFVLGRMNATYQQTIDMVRWLPGGQASDYPPREQRLCEMGRGWRDAKRLEPIPADKADGSAAALQVCDGRMPDPAKYITRINRDMYGNDILFGGQPYIPGIDVAACSARCDELPECKGFSFDRWYGMCFLKNKLNPTVADPPTITGIKLPGKVPAWDKEAKDEFIRRRNTRFHDTPRETPREVESFEACEQVCRPALSCIAFTYDKSTRMCSVFNKTVGPYVDELADSGYKRQRSTLPANN